MNTSFLTPMRLIHALTAQSFWKIAGSTALVFSLCANSLLAQDPFRTTNPQSIGEKTAATFNALFKEGDYKTASSQLEQALSSEPNEPLLYAMKASLAYTEEDLGTLNTYATKTREVAESLKATNPLRGNLYTAVGHFLEGAYILTQEGTVKGSPQALTKLRQAFQHLDAAEKIAPQDPEVNLLKGYMDLMLATTLPFSDPADAISRLEKYAGPRYLADRGIAVGRRNLKQYDKALESINRAVAETPNNPEAHYLKAQILVKLKKNQEAKEHFQTALTKSEQLPKSLVQQMFYEHCKNEKRIENKNWNCDALRDKIREGSGNWGPTELPQLE